MDNKFYLTTAIPYVNAAPHIGFALELVQADVIARYQRLLGKDVYFLTGSDENALKNVQAAEKVNLPVQQFVDQNAAKFSGLKQPFNLSFDQFIQTSDPKHFAGSQALWNACKKKDIYKKKYQGLYCVGCEEFKTEKDLVDGKCPEHKTVPEEIEEENYFFRLSNYQDWLKKIIASDELKLVPETKKNEMLSFIKQGLEDFSISRSVARAKGWGVPIPNDPQQIMYVWFDALANYITALNWQNNSELFKKYWPADLHIIGKGISRFHAIYWPAMLKSAGIAIPKSIFIHGYVTVEGQKISKSLGNAIDPYAIVKKYGTDAVRYYLLKEIPAYNDGDFSENRFKEVYNADLANGLGNLVARVCALVQKNNQGIIPKPTTDPETHPLRVDEKIYNWKKAWTDLDKALIEYRFNDGLEVIWKFIRVADKYIAENKPWELASIDKDKYNWIMYGLLDSIHQVAWMIFPFMPNTATEIAKRLNINKLLTDNPLNKDSWTNIKPGTKIGAGESLFPRLK